jgi:hypothetical protein
MGIGKELLPFSLVGKVGMGGKRLSFTPYLYPPPQQGRR